jgi:Na+-translocating ferredoxin:NAD+ oxidoreductase RnfC subunit
LLEDVKNAGVVGAGGAGFPTHVKLDCKVEYLIVNAAECEPLLATDKYIMNAYPDEIVEGVCAVADHVSASKAFIAIKSVNQKETGSVRDAISRLRRNVEVFPLDNYYPAGDEQMVVYDVTGRTVPPSGIPLEVGAVVSNVATILNIHDAMRGHPVTHKFLTVTGEVLRPMILKVPIGTAFEECLNACGGVSLADFKVIDGGPMMGTVADDADIGSKRVTKTTSGIIIIPDKDNFVSRQHDTVVEKILNRAKSACIQCTFCTDMCPRRLIGHKIRPHMVMRRMSTMDFGVALSADSILEEALICCECGICEAFACPMALSPRQVNKYVKKQLSGVRYNKTDEPLVPSDMRAYRKIAPSKIMARMGLWGLYANKANDFAELSPETVRIPIKQHIGAPARPAVQPGESVSCGQLIAEADGRVSAHVHASIDGVVTEVENFIEIKRNRPES